MLETISAISFNGAVTNGRTKPCRIEGIDSNNRFIDVIAKFSGGCDREELTLATEAICASLAAELGLPIPEPYIVQIDDQFIRLVDDPEIAAILSASDLSGFGSRYINGYSAWLPSMKVDKTLFRDAVGVFAFDCLIQNIDRIPTNPNCLTNGKKIGIFDHDIALITKGVLFWKPPWEEGGLGNFAESSKHIFFNELQGNSKIYDELLNVKQAWKNISNDRINEIIGTLPETWVSNVGGIIAIKSYIEEVRNNIDPCIIEIERILT